MAGGILGIGVTGLQAAQLGIATTSHNIANASTPGYSRQSIVQGVRIPQLSGAGFVGQGTEVDSIRRQFDAFLQGQVVTAESQRAALDALAFQLRQVSNLVGDANAGLSPALQDFFDAVHDVANDPASLVARDGLIGAAGAAVSRFGVLDQRLGELRNGVNGQIAASVGGVNALARQIADLNDAITIAESAVQQPANDLRDQRDQVVVELNRVIGASVVQQGSSYNIFVGNGVPVVLGAQHFDLSAVPSTTDSGRTVVGVAAPGGGTVLIQEQVLQGGSLGGLLEFRRDSLDHAQNAIGRIAVVLAGTVNDQHALGRDLYGAAGGVFFNVPQPTIGVGTANTGNAQLAASFADYGALTASDYRIVYTGAGYVVTRLADGTQQSFGALPATVDGVAISLSSGTANANDEFLLQPVAGGASGISLALSDPARIAAAAPIRTAAGPANTGTGSVSAGSVNAPPPPDANLTQTVTITFDDPPTTFDVTGTGTGNPTNVAYTPGGALSYNGWTIAIDGAPAAGDTFTVASNAGGISDGRNALLLAALASRNTMGSGTATYQSAYAQMVARVGTDTSQAETGLAAQKTFLAEAQAARESVSGVNLDEEAANLIRYQQAYQAAARAIQIGGRLFDDLLTLLG